jgi:hypothetical protein
MAGLISAMAVITPWHHRWWGLTKVAGGWYSPHLAVLHMYAHLWAYQDTRFCQWAVLAPAHLLYLACS